MVWCAAGMALLPPTGNAEKQAIVLSCSGIVTNNTSAGSLRKIKREKLRIPASPPIEALTVPMNRHTCLVCNKPKTLAVDFPPLCHPESVGNTLETERIGGIQKNLRILILLD
jgi:hypothetical protein